MRIAEPTDPAATPAGLMRGLRSAVGDGHAAAWCVDLLAGRVAPDDPDAPPLAWLGGSAAAQAGSYWPRVWAARGLLNGWSNAVADDAVPVLIGAFGDPSWRVREMAAKVIRKHSLDAAAVPLLMLLDDTVPRVRSAACRALGAVGDERHTGAVRALADDEDDDVRWAAAAALDRLHGALRSTPARACAAGERQLVTADDLRSAASGAVAALSGAVDADWSVPAGGVRWSCARTAAHVADDLVAYAVQLAHQARGAYLPFTFAPRRRTPPAGLLDLVAATAAVLADTVAAAPAGARGYHAFGVADAEGFAALGVGEIVLHTNDIATGLGVPYAPEPDHIIRVVGRLLPQLTATADDPWPALLWATGRRDLAGRDRVRRWRWFPAPPA